MISQALALGRAMAFGALSGLVLSFVSVTANADESLSSADRELPVFELQSMADKLWQAESLDGKPWVVNFWASWCPPCIEEIPSMNEAWGILEGKGVGMLAINAGEGKATVETFLKRLSIDFPILLGDANSLPNWEVRALPTTLVISADGRVVYEALGPRDWSNAGLLQKVIDLL